LLPDLDFFKHIFLRVFEKRDPDIFPKSQIFKISFSSHSKNAHIKLNGFQSIFGGWGDMPFIFFMGWMLRFGRNLGSRTTHPSCLSTRGGAIGLQRWSRKLPHASVYGWQYAGRS